VKNFNHVILKRLSLKFGIITLPPTKAEVLNGLNQDRPVQTEVDLEIRAVVQVAVLGASHLMRDNE
jgi:hypothetical protein